MVLIKNGRIAIGLPWFASGPKDIIGSADDDGRDFGQDVIKMILANFNTLTNLQKRVR